MNRKKREPGQGQCALCLTKGSLVESHLLPESLFRPLYDEQSRAKRLEVWPEEINDRTVQKGPWEFLLCAKCDNTRLGALDTYFANTWMNPKIRVRPSTVVPGTTIDLKRLNYRQFKLFHVSVLWRAGIASGPMFRDVNLGPHAEWLRVMLLAGDPGNEGTYMIGGCLLYHPSTLAVADDLVLQPEQFRHARTGAVSYAFYFGGCLWLYVLSKKRRALPDYLNENGDIHLPAFSITDLPRIRNVWEILKREVAG